MVQLEPVEYFQSFKLRLSEKDGLKHVDLEFELLESVYDFDVIIRSSLHCLELIRREWQTDALITNINFIY